MNIWSESIINVLQRIKINSTNTQDLEWIYASSI
jgi:hypothetical protein